MDWAHNGGDLRAAAGTSWGSLAGAPGADLEGLTLDRPARPAARAVRLHLVAAALAGDD